MSQPFESTFVLFVDMLGFAALVEEQGDALDELSPVFTAAELYSPASSESLLGYRFINFHRCLNDARLYLQPVGAGTEVVFSDSAFFRVDTIDNAIEIARNLACSGWWTVACLLASVSHKGRFGVASG